MLQQFYKQSRDDAKAIKVLQETAGLEYNEALQYHVVIRENNRIIPRNLDKAVEEREELKHAATMLMQDRILRCPYCKSSNVKKISFTGKAVSVGTLGLISNKIGKQWHCNNCKSDF